MPLEVRNALLMLLASGTPPRSRRRRGGHVTYAARFPLKKFAGVPKFRLLGCAKAATRIEDAMSFRSIDEVARALRSAVASDMAFGSVSTRVLLRTSVNLRTPRPDQIKDPAAVSKVVAALGDLGYQL
jgi:hypothetical protein